MASYQEQELSLIQSMDRAFTPITTVSCCYSTPVNSPHGHPLMNDQNSPTPPLAPRVTKKLRGHKLFRENNLSGPLALLLHRWPKDDVITVEDEDGDDEREDEEDEDEDCCYVTPGSSKSSSPAPPHPPRAATPATESFKKRSWRFMSVRQNLLSKFAECEQDDEFDFNKRIRRSRSSEDDDLTSVTAAPGDEDYYPVQESPEWLFFSSEDETEI
jgi:hypothetical protein